MKLNPHFLNHKMDHMALVVPTESAGFRGIVKGNQTVGDILDCLEHDTTEEEIVRYLSEKYDGDLSVIREDVSDVLSRLRAIGAIDE